MFERLLQSLAVELERQSIPYMVIGGQAVLLHGEPRLTRDIDVTLGLGANRLSSLLAVVRSIGLTARVDDAAEFVRQTMVLPCEETDTGIRVDFIFSNSPYESEAMTRVVRRRVGDADVCYASVEDLIIHKLVAGRPRDMEDLRGVLLRNPKYDRAYVERWLKDFEVTLGAPLRAALTGLEREIG